MNLNLLSQVCLLVNCHTVWQSGDQSGTSQGSWTNPKWRHPCPRKTSESYKCCTINAWDYKQDKIEAHRQLPYWTSRSLSVSTRWLLTRLWSKSTMSTRTKHQSTIMTDYLPEEPFWIWMKLEQPTWIPELSSLKQLGGALSSTKDPDCGVLFPWA